MCAIALVRLGWGEIGTRFVAEAVFGAVQLIDERESNFKPSELGSLRERVDVRRVR